MAEMDAYIEESVWKIGSGKKMCIADTKTFFYCNIMSKKKGPQCPAKMYTLVLPDGVKCRTYRNIPEHVHDQNQLTHKSQPVRADLLADIRTMLEMNTAPPQRTRGH